MPLESFSFFFMLPLVYLYTIVHPEKGEMLSWKWMGYHETGFGLELTHIATHLLLSCIRAFTLVSTCVKYVVCNAIYET